MRVSRLLFAACLLSGTALASGPSFKPDFRFVGSSIDSMRVVGKAQWTAANGVITGSASSGGSGWLVMKDSLQDVSVYTEFRREGDCETGVLLRSEKTADGGLKGIYVSLSEPGLPAYAVTVGNDGAILQRDKLPAGGGLIRIAPPPSQSHGPPNIPRRAKPTAPLPVEAPDTSLRENDWNSVEIFLDTNTVRSFLNNGPQHGSTVGDGTYGPIALYVGGKGSVQFRDTGYRDMSLKLRDDERVGTNFKKQRLNDFFQSWGTAAADFNHDGVLDVVAGPYIYFGPDYKTSREIFYAVGANPITEFSTNMEYAADFTGDGWPDVIVVSFGGPSGIDLYVNPKGEKRRWEKFSVGTGVQSEIAIVRDLDGDGKPEIIYSGAGHVRFARPNVVDPTGKWKDHDVSELGYGTAHGIGVGDIDGDGKLDILNAYGWWQQPAAGVDSGEWIYHPQAFARYGRGIFGGAVMAVFDVNGDGLKDVVTSLDAHGWGLAWFEQKRSRSGEISFVEHMVMDDFSTKNAGGVTFSEIHGTGYADIDGDGVPDFIAGKRWFSHLDTNIDPDPAGAPVLYWYRTVRNPKAPGGAELVPQLIDTHSGVGSDLLATDLNKDGAVDIVTSTRFGTFIYWGHATRTSAAAKKQAGIR